MRRYIAQARYEDELPETLYHVTFVYNLESIGVNGLLPGGGGNFSGYAGHSRGRLFLTDAEAAGEWHGKFAAIAEHNYDNPIEAGAVPVVLRIDPNALPDEVFIDEAGARDVFGESLFITEPIPASAIEVFDGQDWIPVEDVDEASFIDAAMEAAEVEEVEGDDEDEWEEPIVWPDMDVFLPPEL